VPITVDPATADEIEALVNLWQLYMQDLALFRNLNIENDGRYRDDRLRTYLAYEEHWPLVIRSDGEVVGFALVRKSKPTTYVIGEFFITSEVRGAGIGQGAVSEILQKFAGNWEVPFQNENSIGAAFWRKTISNLGYEAIETKLLNDVWLSFKNT
jgi:predicted acetyltransferase